MEINKDDQSALCMAGRMVAEFHARAKRLLREAEMKRASSYEYLKMAAELEGKMNALKTVLEFEQKMSGVRT